MGKNAYLRAAWAGGLMALLTGCVAVSPGGSGGATRWELVYRAGKNGEPMAGSKDRLIEAVRLGYPVRIGWGVSWTLPSGAAGGIEHVADAGFLSIYQGHVFAQISPIRVQRPDPAAPAIRFRKEDNGEWRAQFSTTGTLHSYMAPTDTLATQQVETYWYVNLPAEKAKGAAAPARLY